MIESGRCNGAMQLTIIASAIDVDIDVDVYLDEHIEHVADRSHDVGGADERYGRRRVRCAQTRAAQARPTSHRLGRGGRGGRGGRPSLRSARFSRDQFFSTLYLRPLQWTGQYSSISSSTGSIDSGSSSCTNSSSSYSNSSSISSSRSGSSIISSSNTSSSSSSSIL